MKDYSQTLLDLLRTLMRRGGEVGDYRLYRPDELEVLPPAPVLEELPPPAAGSNETGSGEEFAEEEIALEDLTGSDQGILLRAIRGAFDCCGCGNRHVHSE